MTERTQAASRPSEARSSALDALGLRALAPVDIAWLAAFRVLFGLMMVVSALRYVAFDWIEPLFVTPAFHFKYWGFGWVEPLPGPWMHALVWALAGLGACVTLGLFFRVASALFAVGFIYLQLIDVATYLNHYYLAGLLCVLLALSPAHRAFSLDAWRKPELRRDTVPAGVHWLFRFQVGVVYVFAGLAKAHGDWLLHAMPLQIWLGSKTDMPVLGALFQEPWAAMAMSWAGFLYDTTIVLWLLWPRTRLFAFAAVLVFHSVTSALFPIGMFPAIMTTAAMVLFSASWPRVAGRAIARLGAALGLDAGFGALGVAARNPPAPRPASAPAVTTVHRLVFAAVAVHVVVQLALPVRYLAYGGNVLWHEQGMRLSWRVMVREKNGSITFVTRDERTGRENRLSARNYLTRWQEQEMWSQPDLILQLGRHIHAELEHDTGHPHSLRVEARVSLNGRPSRPMIDPRVDLSRVEDGLGFAHWITAAPAEPPPALRPVREDPGNDVLASVARAFNPR